jgi:hypothetical protein
MKTRVCTKCGEEKPETDEYFYRNKASRGGLNTICKVCRNEKSRRWYAENPEKAREISERWRAKNPEKVRESKRRWQAENPEKVREARRRWKAKNPEKVMEKQRRWKAKNPEKVREARRRWKAKNPEKVRETNRRYVDTLATGYLKYLITLKYNIDSSEIGNELIEAKRREITYYRQFKQLKQLKK